MAQSFVRLTNATWLATMLGLIACASSKRERVYVVDDAVKVGADGHVFGAVPRSYSWSNPAWDGTSITLSGARRETVAFQIIVDAGGGLRGVDVGISEMHDVSGSSAGAPAFAAFREWYIRVTIPSASPGGSAGTGEYPDPLIPSATPRWGLPVDIAPHRTQAIWIDCAIPASAHVGAYRGTVAVTAGTRPLAEFPITIDVQDFTLPTERHLPWHVGYTGWEAVPRALGVAEMSSAWLTLERSLYRLAWEDHRIIPTTHYEDVRLPTSGSGAAIAIEWSAFDRRFAPYLDGTAFASGVPIGMFSLPINLHAGWPARLEPHLTALDEANLEAIARLVARHWDEKGWPLGNAFAYVADEPRPEMYDDIRRACAAIRRGDARIRRSVAFYTQFGRDARHIVDTFAGLVTMWEMAADHSDPPALRQRQAAGDTIGIYQGGEPYVGGEALDNDGLAFTTWPWVAWRYGLDSLFLYNMTEWDYARVDRAHVPWADRKREIWENPLNQSWATNSQGVLVYPGAYVGVAGFIASIRLKQVRRGMQDYEYLWLASRRGHRAEADAVARRLVPRALYEAALPGRRGDHGPWTHDPTAWAAERRRLAALITQ